MNLKAAIDRLRASSELSIFVKTILFLSLAVFVLSLIVSFFICLGDIIGLIKPTKNKIDFLAQCVGYSFWIWVLALWTDVEVLY